MSAARFMAGVKAAEADIGVDLRISSREALRALDRLADLRGPEREECYAEYLRVASYSDRIAGRSYPDGEF